MNKITPQDIQKGVESVSASPESTWYKVIETLDNGDELCLAIGMGEGFDEDTVCAKLGILAANSAMSDYVWDFQMPWNLKGNGSDIWDTEVSNPGESDAEWFNKTAQEMIRGLESGEIGTSLLGSACGKKKGKKKPVKSAKRPIQSMYVSEDISGNDLYTRLWSGGKDQFESMIEDGADADDILNVVEELLFSEDGDLPTMTDVNDLIWFEPDLIREHLGISNEPIESGCHGKSKKKGKKKAVKSSMSVRDLPRDALHELKERYYAEKYDQDLSYGELANIDDIVSDEEVFDEYDGTSFTEDDFFCLASSRKVVKSGLYENNGTDGEYWYKLIMLDRMLEAMKVDRYSIPKLDCYSEEFDIKTIDIDEGGIQALIDYYASIN